MCVFHESRQNIRQQYKERVLWCFAAAVPLQNTYSPPHLQTTAHQVEMYLISMFHFRGKYSRLLTLREFSSGSC